MPSRGRTFTDDEATRILERAAELSGAQAQPKGLSLEELERIAVEAGLDPSAVRRAALEVRSEGPPSKWRAIFGPMKVSFAAEVDGELDEPGRERVIEALHRAIGDGGHASGVGRVLTYNIQRSKNARNLTVIVSSSEGRTRITIEERLGTMAGAIYGGIGGGFGALIPVAAIGAAVVAGPVGAVAAGVLTAASLFGTTRGLFGMIAKRRRTALDKAMEELRAAVASNVQPPENVSTESVSTENAATENVSTDGALADVRARLLPAEAAKTADQQHSADLVDVEHAVKRR